MPSIVSDAARTATAEAKPPQLSVILPAWNEEPRIRLTLQETRRALASLDSEIIVVDDGSTDGTSEAVRRWAAEHPDVPLTLLKGDHKGKGAAVKKGVLASRGKYVSYIDADLDIHPSELMKLYRTALNDNKDVAVGSKRMLSLKEAGVNMQRRVVSKGFYLMNRFLLDLPVTDTQTGCKVFRGDWIRQTIPAVNAEGFLFDLELLESAARDGLAIAEVPVEVSRTGGKENQIRTKDTIRAMLEYAEIVRRIKRTKYAGRQRPAPQTAAGRAYQDVVYNKAVGVMEEFADEVDKLSGAPPAGNATMEFARELDAGPNAGAAEAPWRRLEELSDQLERLHRLKETMATIDADARRADSDKQRAIEELLRDEGLL